MAEEFIGPKLFFTSLTGVFAAGLGIGY